MGKDREDWLKDILVGEQKTKEEEPTVSRVNGMNRAAALLGKLDADSRERILGTGQSGIAKQLREKTFTFEDLVLIDHRHLPLVLKEVGRKDVLLSLRKASETVKDWVYKSMSARLAGMIQDDLETMAKVPVTIVEQAQQRMVQAALRLEKEGKIAIKGRGEEYV